MAVAGDGSDAVVASHIGKTYTSVLPWKKNKVAVDDVSLRFPAGQVTVLLGHNGAGKSTLIDCVLGLKSHIGNVTIFNKPGRGFGGGDARIGFVAQGNSLNPDLTTRDHIELFAGIHGLSNIQEVTDATLRATGLDQGATPLLKAAKLSGGQKRRLALGIAMIGDPRFVVLDEPTAGVDAEGKVAIRRLIRDLKQEGRVILMTTHAMEEAEVLGDYTAIMVNGKVECEAATLELKKTYGIGYYLHVSKGQLTSADGAAEAKGEAGGAAAQGERLRRLVQDNVKGAIVARESLVETMFVLPMESADSFPALFAAFEANGFAGRYGIQMPSLEEVFIRVTREAEDLQVRKDDLEKAKKTAKKKRAEVCCGNKKQQAAALKAQQAVDELEKTLAGASSSDIVCPALGCGNKFNPPSSEQTVICPECKATFSRAQAAESADDDADGDGAAGDGGKTPGGAGGAHEYQLQPSFWNTYRAGLRFYLQALREPLGSLMITLVMYIVVLSFIAPSNTDREAEALLRPPEKLSVETSLSAAELGIASNDPSLAAAIAAAVNDAAGYQILKAFPDEDDLGTWVVNGTSFAGERGGYMLGDDMNDVKLIYSKNLPFTPYIMLNYYMMILYPDLGGVPLAQLQPLQSGTGYFDFKSTGIVSMYICLIVAIMTQSFGFALADDLDKGRRGQLAAMGFSARAYYGVFLTINGSISLLASTAFVILIFSLNLPFAAETPSGAVVLIMAFTSLAILAWAYVLITQLRNVARWAAVSSGLLVLTMVPGMLVNVVPGFSTRYLWWFDMYPPAALAQAFVKMDRVANTNTLREAFGCESCGYAAYTSSTVFEDADHGLLLALIFPLIEMLIAVALLVIIEKREMAKLPHAASSQVVHGEGDAEAGSFVPLSVSGIEKSFPGPTRNCGLKREPPTQVLRGVDISVRAGQLTGLLGPNGAGKSTAFHIISGKYGASSGSVVMNGQDVSTPRGAAERGQRLYLVQQHTDATMNGQASVRQHLELMAQVKGLTDRAEITRAVDETLKMFDLGDRATAKIAELSGGQGRKGCAALAMLGTIIDHSGKAVVLLDEISAGVDVSARRSMWEAFTKCRGEFAGVLCSHHMEEVDSLCDSIVVLVEGKVVASGSSQELKSRHGKNLQLHLTCTPDAAADPHGVLAFVDANVGRGASLVDSSASSGHIVIDVPVGSAPLASMFAALQAATGAAAGHGIIDYSLAQPTLEQVFIKLVREASRGDASLALARSMSDRALD